METVNPSASSLDFARDDPEGVKRVEGSLRVNGERGRTIKFYTLGCKTNQYDTQNIRERFVRAGFKELEESHPADIYVINTCTVTHRADSRSLGLIHKAKRENPKARVIVTGCLAELDSEQIAKIPGVTHIIKNSEKRSIAHLLQGLSPSKLFRSIAKGTVPEKGSDSGISYFKGHTRAFLKIQDGCNNLCSYCKVPFVRGPSRSRPLNQIINEAARLAKNGFTPLETIGRQQKDSMSLTGFKEIVLCGICLGAYGRDLKPRLNLVDVIDALEKIDGLLRIRLSSIEAGDISGELIAKMAQSKKLCPHLHIPIQSGDEEILKKMNRKITPEGYLGLIRRIKSRIPEIAITTDVLVGFPQEREENFQNTIKLIRQVLPLKVHIFPYSPRIATVAANFKDRLDPVAVKQRVLQLEGVSCACSLIYKKRFLNKKVDVLIESRVEKNNGYWQGYTGNYIKVRVKSSRRLENQFIPLRLKKIVKDYVLAQ